MLVGDFDLAIVGETMSIRKIGVDVWSAGEMMIEKRRVRMSLGSSRGGTGGWGGGGGWLCVPKVETQYSIEYCFGAVSSRVSKGS